MDAIANIVRRLVAPLSARVSTLVSRAILKAVNDAGGFQLVQVGIRAGELRDDVENFQPYGFTFNPLEGAQAIIANVGAVGNHPVALVVADPRHRPKDLEPGEVKLFDHLGKFIHLKADGTLHIKAPRIIIEAASDLRLYAGVSYRWDVQGYAADLRWVGGTNWQTVTYQGGATTLPSINNPINPPQVPL